MFAPYGPSFSELPALLAEPSGDKAQLQAQAQVQVRSQGHQAARPQGFKPFKQVLAAKRPARKGWSVVLAETIVNPPTTACGDERVWNF